MDTAETSTTAGTIQLRFVERRSGLRTDVNLVGWLERAESGRTCNNDFWQVGFRPFWTSARAGCFDPATGTGAALLIHGDELEKLVAGRWDAVLQLNLRADPAGPVLATYTFTFDLTITDHNNAAIYFPLFDQVTPHVGLNIDYNPIHSPPSIGGSAGLDMCLYDGLGSQSPYLEVNIRDDGAPAPGRPAGMYSVWRKGGSGDEGERLDYDITLDYGGAMLPMLNVRTERLPGIDTAQLRLVVLPGMTQPVYCVPTPLTLRTPRVPASSKAQGYYEGKLRIEMNMPTSSPR
ncbi:CfaE/CblD family pilus tip adhesin [Stenotrophomonas sp.]|uniref:CfaE/CblD family pilus tip adhesin n=1 Tax=Stenotrophomonas sp. TaxID=69392 RepID=UPI00289C372C|nr:CfaE/CblD family pilus tip adhesin [Stenotrophomonas sp.]